MSAQSLILATTELDDRFHIFISLPIQIDYGLSTLTSLVLKEEREGGVKYISTENRELRA
jgi:hypothetical protein